MVKITDEWYYEMDEYQYILIRKTVKKKGIFGNSSKKSDETVEKREVYGYYQKLGAMRQGLVRILTKEKYDEGEIKTIEEHISALEAIEQRLADAMRGY